MVFAEGKSGWRELFDSKNTVVAVLLLLAFVVNFFPIGIFVDKLMLGSVFVLIAVYAYGFRAGLMVFLASLIPVYLQQDFALYSLYHLLELAVLALLLRSRRFNILTAEIVFLALFGYPFFYLVPHFISVTTYSEHLIFALSTIVNSIFYASLASVLVNIPVFCRWLYGGKRASIYLMHIVFSMISFIFICASVLYVSLESSRDMKHEINDIDALFNLSISNIENTFDVWLSSYEDKVQGLARELALLPQGLDSEEAQKVISYYVKSSNYFESIYIGDKEGMAIASFSKQNNQGLSRIGEDYSGKQYYRKLMAKPFVSEFVISELTGLPVLPYSVSIVKAGKVVGYVEARIKLNGLIQFISALRGSTKEHIIILDKNDNVIISTSPIFKVMDKYEAEFLPLGMDKTLGGFICDNLGIHHYHITSLAEEAKSEDIYKVSKKLPVRGWSVIVYVPLTVITESYARFHKYTLLVILVVLLASCAMVFILSMIVFRPLRDLAHVSAVLSEERGGSSNDVIRWPESSVYELETLIKALQDMLQGKQKYIQDINQSNIELLQREEDLCTTIDSIGDGIVVCDEQGVVTRMNPVAGKMTGWNVEEVRGARVSDVINIVNVTDGSSLPNPVLAVINNTNYDYQDRQIKLLSKSGEESYISHSVAPVFAVKGNLTGVVMVFKDVSKDHEVEQQMRQAQKMEAIGQLAGGIAHDFNNMLGGIIGFAELLYEYVQDDEQLGGYAKNIIATSERAAKLTGQLLAFSRRGKMFSTVFDLHEVILQAIEILKRSIDRRIEIDLKLAARKSKISGDPSQLQNVFINFGINARDAMENGGVYSVTTRNQVIDSAEQIGFDHEVKPGEYIVVEVADTGTGMGKETIKKIFEPFFTTKGVGRGTGLGLSATYGAVVSHNGAINVFSTPGEGTVFCVFLPVCEDAGVAELTEGSTEVYTASGTILIVDDEEIMCTIVESILSNAGYEVITATSPEEGISIYRQKKGLISLVLMDMIMPQMSGEQCSEALRKINSEVKIVLCSGFTRENIDIKDVAGHYSGFIEKPFRGSQLIKTVGKILKP